MVRLTTLTLSLLAAGALLGCDDEGTTTSCDEMPLLGAAGEGNEDEFEQWYEKAQREGCATPPGDSPGAAGAGN